MNLAMMAASTDEQNFNTMTLAYSTCMNETAIKELGAKPLVNLISQVSDSFPVDDSHEGPVTLGHSDVTSLSNTILLLEKWGITTFEGLGTGADDENPVRSAYDFVQNIANICYRRLSLSKQARLELLFPLLSTTKTRTLSRSTRVR